MLEELMLGWRELVEFIDRWEFKELMLSVIVG